MSKRVVPSEMIELSRRLQTGYVPASPRILTAWAGDWDTALAKVHYLKASRFSTAESLGMLVRIRGSVQVRSPLAEMAKADVEHVWEEYLVRDLRAYHSIEDVEGGFDFHFAAIDAHEQYVTGTVSVRRLHGT